MTERDITPAQTIGPFFAFSLTPSGSAYSPLVGNDLVAGGAAGETIRIEGRVTDGDGMPVADAMIEIWQADGEGRYPGTDAAASANARFRGFGRAECDRDGLFGFRTVKPGPAPGPAGRPQSPHIDVAIFARGLLRHLFTRIYFEDSPTNGFDPILALVPEDRRATLIARRAGAVDGTPVYRFDIHLQGERETAFFEA